ncbi:MAG: hypothetical protein M3Z27_04685 [Actinomycetota bacterium]|nr:hypothetical protein [Actinomycetota bacterium]
MVLAASGCASAVGDLRARPGATAVGAAAVQAQPPGGSCHAREHGLFTLPDPRCTPGAVDRRVTQADIHSTICRRGYTRRVRPPEAVTRVEKRASMVAYGDSGSSRRYEYDHLIPLELGGAPNDPRNLWPEPGRTPNPKDALEDRLRRQVCDGVLPLGAARHQIARDWVAAYRRLIG